jgi:GNAT superfamily N-acetyltransferase
MEVRTLEDRESVRDAVEVHGRAWQEAYRGIVSDLVLERMTVDPGASEVDDWLARLPDDDDPGVAYGVEVGGRVRGYIYVRWGGTKPLVGPSEAGLKELYVHPDWWGGGLGTALVGRGVDALPEDTEALALETLADNDLGRSFYESRGFALDGHSEIEVGGDSYDTVVYRRPFESRLR